MKKRIITHSGGFHADEVFGVATLRIMLGDGEDVEIVRSRDPEVIATGDYVLDVGGIYDASKQRFDHHQEEGAGGRENGILYSSFGLVWKHYGEVVSGNAEVARLIDERLVAPIDAVDNGIDIAEYKFENVRPYTISDVISLMRPSWKDTDRDYDAHFLKAVDLAEKLLEREILHTQAEVEGEKHIRKQIESAPDKRVVLIDHNFPWERVVTEYPEVLYVVYQYDEDNWRVQAARSSTSSFAMRKPLPVEWGGKTGEEFTRVSGVLDATFCHRKLFTCGAKSREGVLKLAELAVKA